MDNRARNIQSGKDASKEEMDQKENNSKGQTVVVKTAVIAIPALTVLAAVLYVQGRLYHESYFRALGINPSQFPVAPADAYWYALNALGLIIGKGIPATWRAYPELLRNEWLAITTCLILTLLILLAQRLGWFVLLKRAIHRRRKATIAKRLKRKRPSYVWIPLLGIAPTVLLPLLTIFGLWLIGIVIYVVALPFDLLGRKEAQYECEIPANDYQLVLFNGDENAGGNAKVFGTARLIQCGDNFCALIRDGETFVIQRSAIIRTIGMPISPPDQERHQKKATKVPKEQMLCYRPPSLKAITTGK